MAEKSQPQFTERLLPSQSAPPPYQGAQEYTLQPSYSQQPFNSGHQASFQHHSPGGSPYIQHGSHHQGKQYIAKWCSMVLYGASVIQILTCMNQYIKLSIFCYSTSW